MGTWYEPGDPSMYGVVDVEVDRALQYLEDLRKRTGKHITLTHMVGKAIAEAIRRNPECNSILRWGKLYRRKTIDVFYLVAVDKEGKDLSGTLVRDADQKTLLQIAEHLEEKAAAIRSGKDKSFAQMTGLVGKLPGWMARTLIKIGDVIMFTFNLWTPLLGVPRDAFGSALITSIGSIGLDMAFAPIVPYMRIGLVTAVGEAKERPVVRDGQVAIAKRMRLCATIDHRLIDGVQGAKLARGIQEVFKDPASVMG